MAPMNDKDDPSTEPESVAVRRGRRSKKETGAAAALQKIKQFRESGEKVKYEVDVIDNIYDEVNEEEYSKVVRKRQLQDDWIVDDDGTGYVDDGREIFDEDLDEKPSGTSGSQKGPKKNAKKITVKKPGSSQPKTIKSMFLSESKSNKPENNNATIGDDEFLDDILQDMGTSKPPIKTPCKGPVKYGGRTPKSARSRGRVPRRLQPAPGPSYSASYKMPVAQKSRMAPRATPPLVSKATKEMKSRPRSSNVFKKDQYETKVTDEREETMEVDHFNGDDEIDYSALASENDEGANDVEASVNGADSVDDFDVDDFGTEAMEALDAVEESALKSKVSEVKVEEEQLEKSKNRGASNLSKPKIEFEKMKPGEAFETIRGQIQSNPEEEFKDVNVDSSSLNLTTNEDGEKLFKFYWFDAYEDSYSQPGTVYLFGKVWIDIAKSYVSCCVIVKNIDRTLFFLPRSKKIARNGNETDEVVEFGSLYQEFNEEIAEKYKIMKFSARRTLKDYAFEVKGIPSRSEYLEVKYSAQYPELPSDLKGATFGHVFGTKTTSLEQLLLQRKLKGPGWLEVKMPQIPNQPVSWCKLEAIVSKPEHISAIIEGNLAPPPLVVVSLSVRTMLNPKSHLHEVLAITGLVHHSFHMDKVSPKDKYFQQYFCAVTKPLDQMFPYDFKNVLKKQDMNVEVSPTERSLLGFFVAKIQKLDPDVLVGHDISTFDLDVLLHRINTCKIPQWSRIGRLRRQVMPKLSFGGKSGFAERTATCGRLICDVKVSSQELIRCKSYDLKELTKVVLKSTRDEIDQDDVPHMYSSSNGLISMLNLTLTDSLYALRIMYELNVMPLALQITNIAGNLMSRTLLGGRSERNEFLLLHAFHEKDFICPDKSYEKKNKPVVSMRKNDEGDMNATTTKKGRKKPAYSGGLVLEPKKGFYDKFILLLDFNSLYPSIIQEYNICYTTVNRTPPEGVDDDDVESWVELPDSDLQAGVLPVEIRKLVERRKEVKKLMKGQSTESDQYLQYDIRQKALKLTANSMYGCLGFPHSRFYAKPLAALVTSKGREEEAESNLVVLSMKAELAGSKILMKTKELVEQMNLDVIYGDTDSIMINTNTTDFKEVFKLGNKVKSEVNKLYKLVEIDIDGVFKSMLLLKKKKYAAIAIQALDNGTYHESKEMKGLDIVRRDWCELAKDTGNFVLDQILSSETRDTIVESIAEHLTKVGEDVQAGSLSLEKFIINKQLTKAPNEYPDKKSLPHVHVALWLKSKNRKVNVGDTIPYVICQDGSNLPMAQRAYHPDEFLKSETLKLDTKYYLAHQVHPVVSRLCDPIDGTDASHIASCLGLDPSGYRSSISHNDENEALLGGRAQMSDDERFKDCVQFSMTCTNENCDEEYVYDLSSTNKQLDYSSCSKCKNEYKQKTVMNKLTLLIRKHLKEYYAFALIPVMTGEKLVLIRTKTKRKKTQLFLENQGQKGERLQTMNGWMKCDDPSCGNLTREVPALPQRGAALCSCQRGHLFPEHNDTSLYTQLLYYQRIFDNDGGKDSWFPAIHHHVTTIIKTNSYSEVDLSKLFRNLFQPSKSEN